MTVSKPVAWRGKSTMAAIHPPNDNRADKLVTKRLSDADKKEIARSASSRLTLPRYPWSLIRSCGRFLLVLCPLFVALFLIAPLWAFFDLTTLCPICLISGSMLHICQGTSILLSLVLFSFHLTFCSSKLWCMLKEKYNGQQGGKRWWLEDN